MPYLCRNFPPISWTHRRYFPLLMHIRTWYMFSQNHILLSPGSFEIIPINLLPLIGLWKVLNINCLTCPEPLPYTIIFRQYPMVGSPMKIIFTLPSLSSPFFQNFLFTVPHHNFTFHGWFVCAHGKSIFMSQFLNHGLSSNTYSSISNCDIHCLHLNLSWSCTIYQAFPGNLSTVNPKDIIVLGKDTT